MTDILSPEDLDARLIELDGWNAAGDSITKTFGFDGFGAAMKFVNQVATAAEQRNHHPDIDVRYDKVTITLSTHSAGGVTEPDIALARLIEEIGR